MFDVQCTPPSSYGSFPIWQVALTMMLDVQCDDAEELKEWEEEDDDEVRAVLICHRWIQRACHNHKFVMPSRRTRRSPTTNDKLVIITSL